MERDRERTSAYYPLSGRQGTHQMPLRRRASLTWPRRTMNLRVAKSQKRKSGDTIRGHDSSLRDQPRPTHRSRRQRSYSGARTGTSNTFTHDHSRSSQHVNMFFVFLQSTPTAVSQNRIVSQVKNAHMRRYRSTPGGDFQMCASPRYSSRVPIEWALRTERR